MLRNLALAWSIGAVPSFPTAVPCLTESHDMPGSPLDEKDFANLDMDRVVADPEYRRRVIDRLRRDPRYADKRRQSSMFYEPPPPDEE